jgi:hypothetical protein
MSKKNATDRNNLRNLSKKRKRKCNATREIRLRPGVTEFKGPPHQSLLLRPNHHQIPYRPREAEPETQR